MDITRVERGNDSYSGKYGSYPVMRAGRYGGQIRPTRGARTGRGVYYGEQSDSESEWTKVVDMSTINLSGTCGSSLWKRIYAGAGPEVFGFRLQ